MSNAKTSKAWFKQHINDPYVKRAQKEGLRSRASFKLLEMQEKYHFVHPGMTIVELGAAPGSWTEMLVKLVGRNGLVIAIDRLEMAGVPQAIVLQGDIEDEALPATLQTHLNERKINWVISDCSPDLMGNTTTDTLRTLYLAQCVMDLADQLLPVKGGLLLKVFQGSGFTEFLQSVKQKYDKVRVIKPKASRDKSREIYILASDKRTTH